MEEINEQDWELINDDGFVYKRLKRHHPDPTPTPNPPDPSAEAKAQTARKKKILQNLKTKYQQEILHWDILSNTLHALQNPPQKIQPNLTLSPVADQNVVVSTSDSTYRELTDTLLAQVEGQEVTINEVSRLCDVVEALCDAEEKRLKQPFIDLPIWEPSPKELVTSLLEEE